MKYKGQSSDCWGKSIEILKLSDSFLSHITQCALFVKKKQQQHINPLSVLFHMQNDSSLCSNTCWLKVLKVSLRSTNKKPVSLPLLKLGNHFFIILWRAVSHEY